MKHKLIAALCGILTSTHAQYNVCWWTHDVLYQSGQPGYTPGFWAFAVQTPASAIVQAGFSYYYTNAVLTHTWYITTAGKVVEVDPGTMRSGSNIVASLSVNVCDTNVRSIHATVHGYPVGYNEAHMVRQDAE